MHSQAKPERISSLKALGFVLWKENHKFAIWISLNHCNVVTSWKSEQSTGPAQKDTYSHPLLLHSVPLLSTLL